MVGPFEKSSSPSTAPPLSGPAETVLALWSDWETMLEAPELLFPSGETRPLCLATPAARFMLCSAGCPAPVLIKGSVPRQITAVEAHREPSRFPPPGRVFW